MPDLSDAVLTLLGSLGTLAVGWMANKVRQVYAQQQEQAKKELPVAQPEKPERPVKDGGNGNGAALLGAATKVIESQSEGWEEQAALWKDRAEADNRRAERAEARADRAEERLDMTKESMDRFKEAARLEIAELKDLAKKSEAEYLSCRGREVEGLSQRVAMEAKIKELQDRLAKIEGTGEMK